MSKKCDRCGQRFEILYHTEGYKLKSYSTSLKLLCEDCLQFFQLLDSKIIVIEKLKKLEKKKEYYNDMLKEVEIQIDMIQNKQKKFFKLKK